MKRGVGGNVVSKPCKAHSGNATRCPQGKPDDAGESHALLWAEADGAGESQALLWAEADCAARALTCTGLQLMVQTRASLSQSD